MAIVIPCAGLSLRYPTMCPKYLMVMHDGQLMIEKVVEQYLDQDQIYIIILKQHDDMFLVRRTIERLYGKERVKTLVLDNLTSGVAETVYCLSKKLKKDDHLFIKDCDSLFKLEKVSWQDNSTCVIDLRKNLNTTKVGAKSFTVVNEQMMVSSIVEKSVVSNYICVGGYYFHYVHEYNAAFKKLYKSYQNNKLHKENSKQANTDSDVAELFVSQVIQQMLFSGSNFIAQEVTNYVDLGTYEEFYHYNTLQTHAL